MTNKELRKLGRRELLEMLITQGKELNLVKKELEDAHNALNDRQILISDSGSIAEAALKLNKVFEAAQEAADQYLHNIRQIRGEDLPPVAVVPAVDQEQAARELEALRAQTEAECNAMREKAKQECEQMIADAQEQCRRLKYDALFGDLKIGE